MALDEALLEAAAAPCLRFYQWSRPTLSLGYFQAQADRQQHPQSRTCSVVRRSTGGGAILHHLELTYSLTAAIDHRFSRQHEHLYNQVHSALIEVLQDWSVIAQLCTAAVTGGRPPFLCFQRRAVGDVVVGSSKIAGSAQRRHRRGLLQHGSVLLRTSPWASELPGIAELTGQAIESDQLIPAWTERISRRLSIQLVPQAEASPPVLKRAAELRRKKFERAAWTERR